MLKKFDCLQDLKIGENIQIIKKQLNRKLGKGHKTVKHRWSNKSYAHVVQFTSGKYMEIPFSTYH